MENIIRITGGFLATDISAWYIVDYKLGQGKWKCTNPGQYEIMEATNKTRNNFPLRYVQENEAIFMLEMYFALNETHKDQVKYMEKNSTTWETSIRARVDQQKETWKYLH